MGAYTTPGVYVEEVSTLPPTVVEVATAVPAFIGYTEKGGPSVARIDTMLEYQQQFGGPKPTSYNVTTTVDPDTEQAVLKEVEQADGEPGQPEFLMHYSLTHYFNNGGGSCFVISVGDYPSTADPDDFDQGLKALEKEDEPTLILLTDAVNLKAADYYTICEKALALCDKLGDRFAILDVKDGAVDDFRDNVTSDYLKYGAAYHPYLQTSLVHAYQSDGLTFDAEEAPALDNGTDTGPADGGGSPPSMDSGTVLSSQVKAALAEQRVILPPSAAMAGIYARVDRDRGVWKAPANVGVQSTIGPVTKITHEEQAVLNVDATGGKSINALRDFAGKGTLVWGARTLAGNDNEWRYVPTRRLFNTIEESSRKASAFAVFEPNDAGTWLKVKGMISSLLYGLWERGALAGPTPESAYFVHVGLGKTMTPQDVLEGRLIVEIGVAAVRPAEFIVIRFSHKVQEA